MYQIVSLEVDFKLCTFQRNTDVTEMTCCWLFSGLTVKKGNSECFIKMISDCAGVFA